MKTFFRKEDGHIYTMEWTWTEVVGFCAGHIVHGVGVTRHIERVDGLANPCFADIRGALENIIEVVGEPILLFCDKAEGEMEDLFTAVPQGIEQQHREDAAVTYTTYLSPLTYNWNSGNHVQIMTVHVKDPERDKDDDDDWDEDAEDDE